MKILLLFSFTIILLQPLFAQDCYVFRVDTVECPEVLEKDCPDMKFLGKNVSMKMAQFYKVYTREIDLGPPAHISSMEIDKPDLYYSIKKLSKYYTKSLKKGLLDQHEAEKELNGILEKCIAIYSQETQPIENELKLAGNPEEILSVFNKITVE